MSGCISYGAYIYDSLSFIVFKAKKPTNDLEVAKSGKQAEKSKYIKTDAVPIVGYLLRDVLLCYCLCGQHVHYYTRIFGKARSDGSYLRTW